MSINTEWAEELLMSHEDVILAVDNRDVDNDKAKQLLKDGKVPAVVYDHGSTTHVSVEAGPLQKAVNIVGRSQPLEITQDGKKHLAMIKQIERHPVKHTFRHVAFQAIKRNETVTAEVPLRVVLDEDNDQTPAERLGLIVLKNIEMVTIKALPKNLPEELTVNGEALEEVGQRLTLGDITLPEGVEFADAEVDLEQAIATVYEPSAIAAANDAAGGDAELTADEDTEDSEEVEAENGGDTNQSSNDAENRPGGKKEFERKDKD